ncbi:DUF262 domain-containing protein [Galactobacter valiniphilus]|uniref:DUF262 domain-containing protein n=1 Tax=Galactobacter valiniphilus TaxID=2676122 RepID=A0A399J603_9MICC|nr:DUF262 domain-containing protein [Galactobacter valiniphilus]RII40898.1 DUF262 domain-containing protein [Galactobacter valiniphilus]
MRGQVTEVYKIYDGSSNQLRVPVYQRNYDWKHKQCLQLMVDLEDLVASDRPKHFFGAVVGKPETAWSWVVIDGQQRLTTVSLLMLALTDAIAAEQIAVKDPRLADRIRSSYLVTEDENTPRFRLKPVKDDAEAYKRLFGPESERIQASNVTSNYDFFREHLRNTGVTADDLWDAICKLEVMHLDLEPHDDPQRIFESLNSTGLALSEADKVRNLVLMGLKAAEQERVYEDYWNRIEKNVDFKTTAFLRSYLITKSAKTPRIDQVFDSFKAFSAHEGTNGAELLGEVRSYSDAHRRLAQAKTGLPAADRHLRSLNLMGLEVQLPFLMPVLLDVDAGRISESDFVQTLRILESYLFRRIACSIPTSGLNKVFATLYKEVRRLRPAEESFSDVLTYSLSRKSGSGRFPDDAEFRSDLMTGEVYKYYPDRRRYLFDSLENLESNDVRDVAAGLESGGLSVEHIMPQTLTAAWREELGEGAEEIHHEWLHRLGNLTVTGYNSRYSNSDFTAKKTVEGGFDASPYRLNERIKKASRWTREKMQARSEQLADQALAYWIKPTTAFAPPQPQLPVEVLGDDTDFTNRAVVAFEFGDAKTSVRNWRELLVSVVQELTARDREGVFTFARTSDWFTVVGETHNNGKGKKEIVPGLVLGTSSSTSAKVSLLRRMFAALSVDTEELVMTFRREEASEEAVEATEPRRFGEVLALVEQLQEFVGGQAEPDDTESVLRDLLVATRGYEPADPKAVLGMLPAAFVKDPERVRTMTAEQVFALVAARRSAAEQLDPDSVHDSLVSGDLVKWLERLAEVA